MIESRIDEETINRFMKITDLFTGLKIDGNTLAALDGQVGNGNIVKAVLKKIGFDTEDDKAAKLINILLDFGYKPIGKGYFSEVMVKGDKAVKINMIPDPCYSKYAEYCMKNWEKNPALPRIYWTKKYKSRGKTYSVTVCEVLEEPTKKNADLDALESYLEYYDPLIPRDPLDRVNKNHIRRLRLYFGQKYPNVIKTVDEIFKTFSGRKCFKDLHIGNVMIRPKTGDIVITDPLGTRL